jgi:DNA replication protein DnaC
MSATSTCPYGLCDGRGLIFDDETNSARDCRCRPELRARARARGLEARIPKRFRNMGLDRITGVDPYILQDIRKYVAHIDEELDAGRGLWLHGAPGTGKTTIAMAVSRAALEAGRTVAIYSLPHLLSTIRHTYDEGSRRTDLELLEQLAAVDLLHLDDLGAEQTTPWVLEMLYTIVNRRYEDQRAVVITTNLTQDDLSVQLGARIVSRLNEMCQPLWIQGPDHRVTGGSYG